MIEYADTKELASISSELLSLADELDSEINTLFSRLLNVPKVTKEWVGGQSESYFAEVAEERNQYKGLILKIRNIGNELSNEAGELEVVIKDNNKE